MEAYDYNDSGSEEFEFPPPPPPEQVHPPEELPPQEEVPPPSAVEEVAEDEFQQSKRLGVNVFACVHSVHGLIAECCTLCSTETCTHHTHVDTIEKYRTLVLPQH